MNSGGLRSVIGLLILFVLAGLLCPVPAYNALLYKSYIVREDYGKNILCDAYIVGKNDWVYKIFRQRGEIAEKDFPRFLGIFKRINPHIKDIDTIHPGQQILIPLKELENNPLPGQESGVVTLPFVTISGLPDTLEPYVQEYKVKEGDSLSKIFYRLYGSRPFEESVRLFSALNPDVKDLDRIYPEQVIRLPDPSMKDKPWYPEPVTHPERMKTTGEPAELQAQALSEPASAAPEAPTETRRDMGPFGRAAAILEARSQSRGVYYFPRSSEPDLKLDLSRFPVYAFENGTRMMFVDESMAKADLELIRGFWKDLRPVSMPAKTTVSSILDAVASEVRQDSENEILFNDNGLVFKVSAQWIIPRPRAAGQPAIRDCITYIDQVQERTPDCICLYLEQYGIKIKDVLKSDPDLPPKPKRLYDDAAEHIRTLNGATATALVRDLVPVLGYPYSEKVPISFPYAGMQIEAFLGLISKPDGNPLLIDFGELYGEALESIGRTMQVIQITPQDDFQTILNKLFAGLGLDCTKDPIFLCARRSPRYNTAIMVPGFLVKQGEGKKILLTSIPLHQRLIEFMRLENVQIVLVGDGLGRPKQGMWESER